MKLERLLGLAGAPRAVEDLHDRGYNFDPARLPARHGRGAWHHDDRRQALPASRRRPGPGGTFERAAASCATTRSPSPARHARLPAGAPLQGRDMMLIGRFLGLDFRLGVRVFDVVDEAREEDGRPVRVFGWAYRTLQGHLERGEMRYEVRKWLDTGEVEFRIAAVSRRAHVGNLLVRIGSACSGGASS